VGELLNLIGLSTGIALYAMLLVMVFIAARAQTSPSRIDPLLLATGVLGLTWNLFALPAYELPKVGIVGPLPFLTSVGFSALGFLPAVVVHSVLRRERDHVRGRLPHVIISVAYGVSAVAALLHFRSLWIGAPLPSAVGMRLLTYTFIALVVPLAGSTRGQPGARRALWAAARSIFAVSALHLSQFHQSEPSWPVELLGHHASLPLAVAILYQDFPFALADLFLKRALTLVVVVATAFVSLATLAPGSGKYGKTPRSARDVGVLGMLWVATALLYPGLQRLSAWFVDTVLLRRPDYVSLRVSLGSLIQEHDDVVPLLNAVCARLQPALSAGVVSCQEFEETAEATGHASRRSANGASIEIPVTERPRYMLEVRNLSGGRRLLSDDHAFLETIALMTGRRVDAIRIARERYDRGIREQEIGKLATEAELRALRSQINPHFLFNALTTIGYLIQTSPQRAFDTLMRLTALLRGVLRSEGEMTTLGRELDLIESYLDIERARFEERLRVAIRVSGGLRAFRIPPLLLQPIVENAVKHGIAPERHGGDLAIEARLDDGGDGPRLIITVHDSGAGATEADGGRGRAAGVGLNNIARRLALQYGESAGLAIRSAPGTGTTVELRLPAELADTRQPALSRSAP
jgi:two-component system, LytTR family, sensor kinase